MRIMLDQTSSGEASASCLRVVGEMLDASLIQGESHSGLMATEPLHATIKLPGYAVRCMQYSLYPDRRITIL